MAEFEHMSNRMMETYALMNPHSIQKELVLRLHESAMDGFKYRTKRMDFGTRRYQIEAKTIEENVWQTIPTCLRITDDNVSGLAM